MNRVCLALVFATWIASSAPNSCFAHSLAATPNLEMATSGSVFDALVEPDGHVIVAGRFDTAGDLPRLNLARLNPDGTTDPTWAFDTNGTVYSVARSSAGHVYVVGSFSEIDGVARAGAARISSGPGAPLVDSWVPEDVYSAGDVEVSAGDDVYLLIDDFVRRFPAGGNSSDPEWTLNVPHSRVWDIAVSPDGQTVATCALHGELRQFARNGALASRLDWDGACNEMAFAPDGTVFVARWLNEASPLPDRQVISRILTNGLLDASWERELGPAVDSFAFLASGAVWVGTSEGRFVGDSSNTVGFNHTGRGQLFRFQSNGVPIAGDEPVADSNYEILEPLPGGDVLAGGSFKIIGHQRRDALARLHPETAETGAQAGGVLHTSHSVAALLKLSDGSYLVSGPFTRINGQPRRMLARLSADFQVLPDSWELDDVPIRMLRDEAGYCLLGGLYPLSRHSPATLIRLYGCAAVDTEWRPEVRGLISALATGSSVDSTIHVASCDDVNNGMTSDCRVQQFPMSATGSVAATWTLPTYGGINALLHESGALYAAGRFTEIGAQPRSGVAKLAKADNGVIDTNWIAERSPRVAYSLASVGDGEIIVSGIARTLGSRPALIRLSSESGVENLSWRPWQDISDPFAVGAMTVLPDRNLYFADSGYNCCVGRTGVAGSINGVDPTWTLDIDGRVDAMVAGGPGELLVAGSFFRVDGVARSGLARLIDVHPVLFVDQFE